MTSILARKHAEPARSCPATGSTRCSGFQTQNFTKWTAITLWLALGVAIFISGKAFGKADDERLPTESLITNVCQLQKLASSSLLSSSPVQLEGALVWINQARDQFILQDNSGAITINLDLHKQPTLEVGQQIRFQGDFLAGHGQVSDAALVDNDGVHSAREKSGSVFLSKGPHPIGVEWFNDEGEYALEVEWMGPNMARRPISSTDLVAAGHGPFDVNAEPAGLYYYCYEGKWDHLPDFYSLIPKKQGTATNFDLNLRTRSQEVGLRFEGWIEAPTNGIYTFWTKSDDGSKLFIGRRPPHCEVLGPAQIAPVSGLQRSPHSSNSALRASQWVEVTGDVLFISSLPNSVVLKMNSNEGDLQLKINNVSYDSVRQLRGCRIKATGLLQSRSYVTGQPQLALEVPDLLEIGLIDAPREQWNNYPLTPLGSLATNDVPGLAQSLVRVGGIISSNLTDTHLIISDGTGNISVKAATSSPHVGEQVEAMGWLARSGNNWEIVGAGMRDMAWETNLNAVPTPLLTNAVQAKSLSPAEANRGYAIRIRGVITSTWGGFTIQDSTWSIFFKLDDHYNARAPKIGEFWEISGKTTNSFAPNIIVDSAIFLSDGVLPEPIRPSWDELINGSLDTQYVEMQGVATDVKTNSLTLFTREGKIELRFFGLDPEMLKDSEDAVVSIRGVVSPDRDKSLQIVFANVRLFCPSINVDEPAPRLPFAIPLKRVSDLLFYDFHASALKRIRVQGQVIHARHEEYFLQDGSYGVRFHTKAPEELNDGDTVEIVGFPDMSGSALVLRDCLVRKIGHAAYPDAYELPEKAMLNSRFDSTLVRVQATLVNLSANSLEQVLELQAGNRNFMARLEKGDGSLANVLPGSRLDLSGVYVGQGGDWSLSRDVDSFELLLNSPSDVHVLERPSWWTIRHTINVLEGMAVILILASIWIVILRRQVEERTRRLTAEISLRKQAEYQRFIEAERSRIAQDLHDDLGATLTQISFLSTTAAGNSAISNSTQERLKEVSEKSLQMITSLDEIVWVVNPENDSLRSLATYLQYVAEDFVRGTSMSCRFDVDKLLPLFPLNSEVRHNLYHLVREALNNCVKHSHGTELWLRIHWRETTLQIIIEDNGCGFETEKNATNGNGLANMRRRMDKIGGSFVCKSQLNSGTKYDFHLPLK